LLYDGPLLCGFNVAIKGLIGHCPCSYRIPILINMNDGPRLQEMRLELPLIVTEGHAFTAHPRHHGACFVI